MDLSMESDKNWGRLTEDLWLEIFKRSPIKSQGRFRCVCKSWKSLVSSSFFINLHHSFSCSATPGNLRTHLRAVESRHCRPQSFFALCRRPQETDPLVEHMLHFPLKLFHSHGGAFADFTFVDVIRGVVCVSYSSTGCSDFDSIILWNPAIRKYIDLPNLLPFPSHLLETAAADLPADFMTVQDLLECHAIGFGYDACSDDFKVVRIWIPDCHIAHHCPSLPPKFELYSAREGHWRMAEMAADDIINHKSCQLSRGRSRLCETSCFVNGTIHWLLSSDPDDDMYYLVLMFDCEREEFKTMELPQEIHQSPVVDADLLEYAGMLCALVQQVLSESSSHFVLWAMEEHGVASSWKKLCRISNRYELELKDIDIYQPSLMKLASCGPDHWIKLHHHERVLSCHAYDETLFLMNHPKAQSYAKDETVEKQIARLEDYFVSIRTYPNPA